MRNMKRIMGLALTLVLALSLCVPAFAAEVSTPGGNSGDIPVEVSTNVDGDLTFKVTMPTAFSIAVDKDGAVTCASDLKIVNQSAGAVDVKNMTLAGANEWTVYDYEDEDYNAFAVNSKAYGISILANDSNATGGIDCDLTTFVNDNGDNYMWAGIGNDQPAAHNEIALPYEARVAAQNTALTDSVIGNVVFTVGWYEAA